MLNFEEYHKEYLKKYPIVDLDLNSIVSKKKYLNQKLLNSFLKQYRLHILAIPIVFTFALNFIIPEAKNEKILFNLNTNDKLIKSNHDLLASTINNIYSEKSIDSNDNITNKFSKPSIISFEDNNLIKEKKNFSEAKNNKKNINESFNIASIDWKKNYSKKKIEFIKTLLPIIAFENQKIVIERNKLLEIKKFIESNNTLNTIDILYLENIAKKYSVDVNKKHKIDLINDLLNHVNIIPNSIVLAQAVNESGWGSSRFAKEYNALFGQYTYDVNKGVIPYEREEGKKHLIKNFISIDKSVESYFININSHYAYEDFRNIRSNINFNKLNESVKLLTKALDVYAEDKSYVKIINAIIESNNLTQFDSINLSLTNS